MDPRIQLAYACYDAYVRKDRAALEALIAPDFHFTSPLDNRIDRTTYFERCWPNSKTINAFEFLHEAVQGDRVYVTYEGRATNDRRFRNTEVLTLRGSQIVEVEVYFGWTVPHDAPPGGFIEGR
jgi:ketosteroid isomerase-like protein